MNADDIDGSCGLPPAWGKLRQSPAGRQEQHALIDHMPNVAVSGRT